MKKSILPLLLVFVILLALTACGSDIENSQPSQGEPQKPASSTPTHSQQVQPSQTQPTDPATDYTKYLRFKLNDDEQSYTAYTTPSGYNGPGTELVIPSHYKDLPVTVVKDLHLSKSDVERVVLPDTVIELGDYAFSDSKVKDVVFSKNLQKIGDCAFSGCTSLTQVDLPEGLVEIGASAFRRTSLTSLVLPSTVAEMGMDCFAELEHLTEVTITCAGGRAFKDCPALKTVTVIQGAGDSIGDKAFYDCDALECVVFEGDNITHIYSDAFRRCSVLATVTLPSKLEFIGSKAFDSCYALETLEIPDTVTKMEENALMTDMSGDPHGTIICSAGSYAEKYAKQNKYTVTTK